MSILLQNREPAAADRLRFEFPNRADTWTRNVARQEDCVVRTIIEEACRGAALDLQRMHDVGPSPVYGLASPVGASGAARASLGAYGYTVLRFATRDVG
jgi:hypothetical protein